MFDSNESGISYNSEFIQAVWKKRREAREAARKKARLEAIERANARRKQVAVVTWIKVGDFDLALEDELSYQSDRPTVRSIINSHAKAAGIGYRDIVGGSRRANLVKARQAAMAETYERRRDLSLVQIGKAFGGRDHTTVLHAIQKLGVWRGGE